ncbi:MAG: prephenate dehydrogenase [Calditerrivibrio sp.]|nr:prephenate dehydrogenase [Calditerrivibrio sp.]MCA1932276.1 prephenate dehydrogenase [Calditerrivibrio sp.]
MTNSLQIGIIGIGLIGGSLAKAFRSIGNRIIALDDNKDTLENALKSGIFERCHNRIEDFLQEKLDLIYIATPIDVTKEIILNLGDVDCKIPITDASSTKSSITKLAKDFDINFCGGHPIAGKEKSGFLNSNEDIFKDAIHILTEKDTPLSNMLQKLHEDIGMKVFYMDPETHDKIFALVSHFPHLTAFSLVEFVNRSFPEALKYSGGGFKDFTRIAGSDPTMWSNIFIDNKSNIIDLIDGYINLLEEWKNSIQKGNKNKLFEKIELISNIRKGL